MISWFGRRGAGAESPRGRARAARPVSIDRQSIESFQPDPADVLGRAAYLQLAQFEALSRAASSSPSLTAKQKLSDAAGLVLGKHRDLVAELTQRGHDAEAAMAPHAAAIDAYEELVAGADWHEALASIYLTSGLLDDFFARVLASIDGGDDASRIVAGDSGRDAIVSLLGAELGEDSRVASRLAVWGRRLVGDTLLLARSVLHVEPDAEHRIEPALTELMAEHTRRMDRLGLTA